MSEQVWLDKDCPICEQGRLYVLEDTTNDRLYIHCEECESAWVNPEDFIANKSFLAINPDFKTRIPSKEKVDKSDWIKYNLKTAQK